MSTTKQVRMREFDFGNGIKIHAQDLATSGTLDFVAKDITDNSYGLKNIDDDARIIIDIGAHVGLVAIYLAKKYPDAHIYAVEPFPVNVANLRHNIEVNNVKNNITVMPTAISKNARTVHMGCFDNNTGGVLEMAGPSTTPVGSITFDRLIDSVLERHSFGSLVSFVKMDIEGFEYEILPEFKSWDRIKHAGIEVHNRLHEEPGYLDVIEKFMKWIHKQPIHGKMWTPAIEAFVRHG